MSKAVKEMIATELRGRYAEVNSACVVDITGLSVIEQETLRRSLRPASGRLEVVKNSLARRALKDTALAPLGDSMTGPCALVTSASSLIDVAKVLVEQAKEFSELELKQAILEGNAELLTVAEVSKMKSHAEMIGEIAMLVGSPGRAVASCVGSAGGKIAGCLKAIVDKAA